MPECISIHYRGEGDKEKYYRAKREYLSSAKTPIAFSSYSLRWGKTVRVFLRLIFVALWSSSLAIPFSNLPHFASTMDASLYYSCLHLQLFHGAPGVLWPNWSSGKGGLFLPSRVVCRESSSDTRWIFKNAWCWHLLMLDQSMPSSRTLCVSIAASVRVGCGERCGKTSDGCKFIIFYRNNAIAVTILDKRTRMVSNWTENVVWSLSVEGSRKFSLPKI